MARIPLLRQPLIPFFDQLFKLFVLLRDSVGVSRFIRSTRHRSGLLNELTDVVPNNRDAILKFRKRKRRKRTIVAHRVSPSEAIDIPYESRHEIRRSSGKTTGRSVESMQRCSTMGASLYVGSRARLSRMSAEAGEIAQPRSETHQPLARRVDGVRVPLNPSCKWSLTPPGACAASRRRRCR